jgi:NAD(P)H-flavin reductase
MRIIINNNIYDITTFIQEHPGGPDVFKLDENKDELIDFTQKFNDVGHSEYAVNLLENYKVDELSEDDPRFNRSNKLEYNKTKISKLVTHEDKFHLHKILGCVSLLNYFYLLFDCFYSGAAAEMTLRTIDSGFIGLTWVHSVLSLSALQFLIPRTRTGIMPMIWQEFRAHSIVFAVRSFVLINLMYFIAKKCDGDNGAWYNTITGCVRLGIVLLAMKLADLSTEYLRENKKETTTATMPYWSDCPANVQSAIKYFYTHSQIMATFVCLFGEIPYILAVAFPIQFASFMMTLVRKNIISSFWYHVLYGGSLLAVYLINAADIRLYPVIILGSLLIYLRVHLKMNKYALWTIVGIIGIARHLITGTGSNVATLLQFTVSLLILCVYIDWSDVSKYIFDTSQTREESNHRVVTNVTLKSSDRHENDVGHRNHMITIHLCEEFPKYKPGMYFNLYFDTKKRPYTPVEYNHNNTIKFLIKRVDRGEVSPVICDKYLANNTIFIKGPFGRKYYDPEASVQSFICDGNVITAKHIVLCSCGSGITPLYSMGVAWMKDHRTTVKNQNLHFMSSYATSDDAILRLTTNKMDSITEKLFISKEGNKLTPSVLIDYINDLNNEGGGGGDAVAVFTCGTINYNQMISDCCKITNVKCYEW